MTPTEVVLAYLDLLFSNSSGTVEVSCKRCGFGNGAYFTRSNLEEAAEWAVRHTGCTTSSSQYPARTPSGGVYVRMTTLRSPLPPGRRGTKSETLELGAFWLDIDFITPYRSKRDLPSDISDVRPLLEAFPLAPSLIVDSGGGIYPVWLLESPVRSDVDDVLMRWGSYWAAQFRGGGFSLDSTSESARILRLPGTLNHKTSPPRPVATIDGMGSGLRYGVEDVIKVLPPIESDTSDRVVGAASARTVRPAVVSETSVQPIQPSNPLALNLSRCLRDRPVVGQRSDQFWHLVNVGVAHRLSDGEILWLIDRHPPSLDKWPSQPVRHREALWAAHKVRRGRAEVVTEIRSIRQHLLRNPISPRSLQQVLLAHLEIAEQLQSFNHRASVSMVAERTLLSAGSISRAWAALQEAGWLELRFRGRRAEASRWRLTLPVTFSQELPPSSLLLADVPPSATSGVGHDAFARRGLGAALATYDRLSVGPQTAAEVARGIHRSPRTVREHLQMLAQMGLVARLPEGRWTRCDRSLDEVAIDLGVAGTGERLRRHHQDRRARQQRYLQTRPAAGPSDGHFSRLMRGAG